MAKTFRKEYFKALGQYLNAFCSLEYGQGQALAQNAKAQVGEDVSMGQPQLYGAQLVPWLAQQTLPQGGTLTAAQAQKAHDMATQTAMAETDRATYQAMEALVHNLNTMNSRAGAQVPFSSVNYGTDTSPEGRMVIRNLLLATDAGLGNGETPIFPVQIFKVKEGINYNSRRPQLRSVPAGHAGHRPSGCSPTSASWTPPSTCNTTKKGDYNSEVAYMGCRTRVMGNVHDPEREITCGRGNLSFTSINLPRLGIEANGDLDRFYEMLDEKIDLVIRQLLHRFKIQAAKKVPQLPLPHGTGRVDRQRKAGSDGRACGRSPQARHPQRGLYRPGRDPEGPHRQASRPERRKARSWVWRSSAICARRMDEESQKTGLNFTLLATPAEGLSGRFVRIDQEDLWQDSGNHRPGLLYQLFPHPGVLSPSGAFDKIRLEAPYHALTNAGHISYVELDGDAVQKPEGLRSGDPLHEGSRRGLWLGEPSGGPGPGVWIYRRHRRGLSPLRPPGRRGRAHRKAP